jgi:hypothetical protein
VRAIRGIDGGREKSMKLNHDFFAFRLLIIRKNSPWHKDFFRGGGLK